MWGPSRRCLAWPVFSSLPVREVVAAPVANDGGWPFTMGPVAQILRDGMQLSGTDDPRGRERRPGSRRSSGRSPWPTGSAPRAEAPTRGVGSPDGVRPPRAPPPRPGDRPIQVGLLPPGRDHARPAHLPGTEPELHGAGAGLPRALTWPGVHRTARQQALLPRARGRVPRARRTGGRAVLPFGRSSWRTSSPRCATTASRC